MSTRYATWLCLALVLSACSDGGPTSTAPADNVSFVIVSGDGQSGPPGAELPQPLVVRAVDGAGNPVPGRHVAFKVISGGGSMYLGAGVSDANGIVKDYWTLGTVAADSQRVEARSIDPATGAKQVFGVFRATIGGEPVRVDSSGAYAHYTGQVGKVVPFPYYVQLEDQYGNPVRRAGVAVKWTPSGDGTMFRTTTYTDSLGRTGVRWYFGTVAGPQTLSAQVVGGEPARVLFTGTAVPGPAVSVDIEPDSVHFTAFGQLDTVTVTAVDQYGNATPRTWSQTSPGVVHLRNLAPPGMVLQAAGNGRAYVIVTSGSIADSTVVVVRQEAATISFSESLPSSVKVGGTVNVKYYTGARDANNHYISSANTRFTWSITNPSVATINANGILTAHAPGSVKAIATMDGVSAETPTITVSP
ncbi:MAG TPA: Ig-like domain-containing protein [Longimicrobium sp.]|nr:Ig-like domain-containing protein [Longimicrobium sp.]